MDFEKDLKKALGDYENSLVEHYEALPHPGRRKAMKKRKWIYSLAGLAAVFLIFVFAKGMAPGSKAGGNSYPEMAGTYDYASPAEAPMEEAAREEEGATIQRQMVLEDQKIIRTYNISLETKDIKRSMERLEKLVEEEEGYIESSYQDGKLQVGEWAQVHYTIRIPRGQIEKIRLALEELGQVSYFSQAADNVTRTYQDTQARIELLELKEKKLKELLVRAESLEDVITLENSIMDMQFERESITSFLRDMDNRIDYDTFYIGISQVVSYTEKSFGERFKDSFGEGLRDFGEGLEDFIIFLSYSWAYLVLLALLGVGVYFLIKKIKRKKHLKKL